MDVLLLGTMAVVLIALTLWIVWRPTPADETAGGGAGPEEASGMLPQGDRFEDQYTSATADLSAAGVALTTANPPEAAPILEAAGVQDSSESVARPTLEGAAAPVALPKPTDRILPEPSLAARAQTSKTVSVGLATLFTLGGAIGGALLYGRWLNERNKPLNRLRRRFK
jgi:hypothetical protein